MQNIRTDLAVEAHELSRREAKNATEIDGVISDVRTEDGITITNIEITNENGSKALGKAIGNYITIESPNTVLIYTKGYALLFRRKFVK